MVQDNDDDIIELTQVVGEESSEDADQEIIELTDIDTGLDASGEEDLPDEMMVAGPGEADETDVIPMDDADVPDVTQTQLEDALERVIEKKFSKTIEKILFEVMEKVIQKEIAEIKEALQKDLDDIGKS